MFVAISSILRSNFKSLSIEDIATNMLAYTFVPLNLGFAELSADLAEVAIAHCQLIVVSK